MEDIIQIIQQVGAAVLQEKGVEVEPSAINVLATRKEFEGDFTIVTFPFTKALRQKPEAIGEMIGQAMLEKEPLLTAFNVVKGFLNLSISDTYWVQLLNTVSNSDSYGFAPKNGRKIMVEFSSPNTNKPLHLGHIRNILLGWSASKLNEMAGYEVIKTQIFNDRGIAICKSMLSWTRFGNNGSPESEGLKPDHFVGKYYVLFEKSFAKEYQEWQTSAEGLATYEAQKKEDQSSEAFFKAFKNTYFNQFSSLGKDAKAMLLRWEAGDPETIALWKKMNQFVYDGFNKTYESLGVSFDKNYRESETYLLGKDLVDEGLNNEIFFKKDDDSVWIDLEDAGMDQKIILRSDGTSVYMTQDLGTAEMRYKDFECEKMLYVVADEQNYHFKVLFEILKRFDRPYADGLYHLSYGMVDLPTGKMKTREGTVVDADDLMLEVIGEARKNAAERGELESLSDADKETYIRRVGMAALKFFIIKVGPKKRMIFNPSESVDLQGQTGPYIQYSYVRTRGVLRKAAQESIDWKDASLSELALIEKEIARTLYQFPSLVVEAAETYDPSLMANYCYDLAKLYSKFWNDQPIFKATPEETKFRLMLSAAVANVLRTGMASLGIEMPEKM